MKSNGPALKAEAQPHVQEVHDHHGRAGEDACTA